MKKIIITFALIFGAFTGMNIAQAQFKVTSFGELTLTTGGREWSNSFTTFAAHDNAKNYVVNRNGDHKFFVYGSGHIIARGAYINSDLRFKKDIKGINNIANLYKLNAKSYKYITDEANAAIDAKNSDTPESDLSTKNEYGFIAQDIEQLYPDLVMKDEKGYLSVNYIGLIPVIIEALKDQQQIIGAQSAKIKELESKLSLLEYPNDPIITPIKPINTKSDRSENAMPIDENSTFLFQNTPNPFTQTTEIRYFLPENAQSAKLFVFNIQGQNVKTVDLQGKGMGSITIKAAEFAPGTYTYILHANGKELDAKRMILTK